MEVAEVLNKINHSSAGSSHEFDSSVDSSTAEDLFHNCTENHELASDVELGNSYFSDNSD